MAFALFGVFFVSMLVYDLRTGEIWRGGPEPTITVVKDAAQFYTMISFFVAMSLVWWGGVVWTLVLLLRRKSK